MPSAAEPMPNRIIRDSARSSPTLDQLSDGAERTFWRLTTAADDYGRFLADPRWVLAQCHPLQVGRMRPTVIEARLNEMGDAGLVAFYANGDERVYGVFLKSDKYFDRRARSSRYPDPPGRADMCAHVPADASRCSPLPRYRGTEVPRLRGTEEPRSEVPRNRTAEPPVDATPTQFRIPASVSEALQRAPLLGQVAKLRDPSWWRAELRANPGVDLAKEVLKAEAWLTSNPSRAPRKQAARFLHTWLARAEREE